MYSFLLLASMAFAEDLRADDLETVLPPDPAVATVLSAHVGFGAGHFYSRRPAAGTTHLTVQLASIGLAGVGLYNVGKGLQLNSLGVNEPDYSVPSVNTSTLTTGSPQPEVNVTDPSVDYSPNSDLLLKGSIMLTSGVTVYLVDRLVDTLTAPSSARRRTRKLNQQ